MGTFSKLPCEIRENIFSRIRIRDLYEVSVVSEEWWWLTMRSYKAVLTEDDELIKTLLAFYNRAKKLLTPLEWFNLVKYCNFRDVRFDSMPRLVVFESFLKSRRQIRSLSLRTGWSSPKLYGNLDTGSNQHKLDMILKYFPNLQKLELHEFIVDPNFLKIPKGIKKVHLSGIAVNGVAWSSLFEDPDSVQSLEIYVRGLTFDFCAFKGLENLILHFGTPLPDHQMKRILELIRGHKLLRSVTLYDTKITKEWFNVFGETIENITLKDNWIDEELLTELGNDGCYERRVMSFVCSDIRTLKRFTSRDMQVDVYGHGENEEFTGIDYRGEYTCKPHLMEEKLYLQLDSSLSRSVQTITTTDDGPSLRDLHIRYEMGSNVKAKRLTSCVPGDVTTLRMELIGKLKNLSIGQLCEQPQILEELNFYSSDVTTSLSFYRDCFTSCTRLKVLYLAHVDRKGLQNLMQHCVCLEKLKLSEPKKGVFADLNASCVSKSVRKVELYRSDASLEDVLLLFPNLEVLKLTWHLICPLSIPSAIAQVKFFSAMFHVFSDIRKNYKSVALLMDTVDVPCKLFYCYKGSFTFKLGLNDSIMDDLYDTAKYAYCRGLPTRYLAAQGIKILDNVKHFNEKCLSRR